MPFSKNIQLMVAAQIFLTGLFIRLSHIHGFVPLQTITTTTTTSFVPKTRTHHFLHQRLQRNPLRRFGSKQHLNSRSSRSATSSTSSTTTLLQMCQLLGMNSAHPMDFTLHFHGFRQRGGRTDVHSHGWGCAFYDDPSNDNDSSHHQIRSFHDTQPAATSELANVLASSSSTTKTTTTTSHQKSPIDNTNNKNSNPPIHTSSCNMMTHLRYATHGPVDLANVHPFQRELWGIPFLFCHNGDVPLAAEQMPTLVSLTRKGQVLDQGSSSNNASRDDHDHDNDDVVVDSSSYYHPVGQTDSERIFCAMLNALRARFSSSSRRRRPSYSVLYQAIQDLCHEIVQYDPSHTILNFLLACGPHTMWAYSWPGRRTGSRVWNGLHYIVQQPPFRTATLRDLDGCTVDLTTTTTTTATTATTIMHHQQEQHQQQHHVSFIATKPITYEEEWVEFEKGQLIVFDHGMPHMTAQSLLLLDNKQRTIDGHDGLLPPSSLSSEYDDDFNDHLLLLPNAISTQQQQFEDDIMRQHQYYDQYQNQKLLYHRSPPQQQ